MLCGNYGSEAVSTLRADVLLRQRLVHSISSVAEWSRGVERASDTIINMSEQHRYRYEDSTVVGNGTANHEHGLPTDSRTYSICCPLKGLELEGNMELYDYRNH